MEIRQDSAVKVLFVWREIEKPQTPFALVQRDYSFDLVGNLNPDYAS
jgi:hypothetical protein